MFVCYFEYKILINISISTFISEEDGMKKKRMDTNMILSNERLKTFLDITMDKTWVSDCVRPDPVKKTAGKILKICRLGENTKIWPGPVKI